MIFLFGSIIFLGLVCIVASYGLGWNNGYERGRREEKAVRDNIIGNITGEWLIKH